MNGYIQGPAVIPAECVGCARLTASGCELSKGICTSVDTNMYDKDIVRVTKPGPSKYLSQTPELARRQAKVDLLARMIVTDVKMDDGWSYTITYTTEGAIIRWYNPIRWAFTDVTVKCEIFDMHSVITPAYTGEAAKLVKKVRESENRARFALMAPPKPMISTLPKRKRNR